jgi:hypothetical protein
MPKALAPRISSSDPLKTVAKAMKDGAMDAKEAAGKLVPAAGRFLSRFVYTTSYTLAYGVVFPAVLVAKSIPPNNAVVHGFVDGARAASDMADQLKHRPPEAPAKPHLPQARSNNKGKRKTSRGS